MEITLQNFGPELYAEAHSKGMSLSQYLEMTNPSPEGSKLDAYERLMKEAGILTQSNPSAGFSASNMEAFYRTNENKALFPEFVARTMVRSMMELPMYRHLVGLRTAIEGGTYQAAYVDPNTPKNKKALEMKRVAEAADLPRATLKLGSSVITLYKYGRAVEASYEVLRRMNLELFQRHIRMIALAAAENKVDDILAVIKDGDGNDNAATVIDAGDIVSSATSITRDVLIDFMLDFSKTGGADTIVANKEGFKQILDVVYPSYANASNIDNMIKQGLGVSVSLPQNLISNFTLLYSPNVDKVGGKEAIYAFNRADTIEEVYELGSIINEADINVINQTKLLTVSENSGFRKMFKDTSKILTFGA